MFGMFNPDLIRFKEWREEKAQELGKRTDNDHCVQCTLCCWTRPCTITREDMGNICDMLKITPEKFFQEYCSVDTIHGNYTIVLRRKDQVDLKGKYVPGYRTYDHESACMFLGATKDCLLQAVKPTEGLNHKCWDKQQERAKYIPWTIDELKKLGWDGITED